MTQVTVVCPNCSARYVIHRSHLGRAALCNQCNERFVLEDRQVEGSRGDPSIQEKTTSHGGDPGKGDPDKTVLYRPGPEPQASDATQEFAIHPTLEVVEGVGVGRIYELSREEITVGRGRECHIVLHDDCVSRVHAQLIRHQGTYLLEDLKSKNGTFVNGQRVVGPRRLEDDDRIQISGTVFAYRCLSPPVREKKGESGSSLVCSIDATGSSAMEAKTNAERKLQAILRINQALGRTLDLEAVLSKMLGGLFEIFPQADRGLVLLREGQRLVPKAVKQRNARRGSIQFSRTIVEKAMDQRQAILSEDVFHDDQIPMTASLAQLEICSIMCVPLLSQDSEPLGVIQLDTQDRSRKFSPEDMQILTSVASQASISVEYAQLHRESIRHAQIEKELEVARVVQHSFLPCRTPELAGYRFWAFYQAAGQVGGDFYDFLHLPNGKQAVLIGDVAGKGIPAALMMAKMSGLCKVALLNHPDCAARAMEQLNREVCQAGLEFGLVTLVLCLIDPASHRIDVANAGHLAPMFLRADGRVEDSVGTALRGFPLGFDPQSEYGTETTQLGPGEYVLLVSDGISEAMNAERQLYTTQRIRGQLAGQQGQDPEKLGEAILEDVRRHVAGYDQKDDMTMVVVQREPVEAA